MLLRDDVVGDRQAEARALAGWLGGEERLEQFIPDLGRYAGAVVSYANLGRVTEIAGGDPQRGIEPRFRATACTPIGRVKSVAEDVQEYPRDVLRVHLDRRNAFAKVPLQRNTETLILRAGSVIGEV